MKKNKNYEYYEKINIRLQMLMFPFEAESIAFTVCQHFGIDTSDYSFGYIAGWSSGKEMKELKTSLDTIRKTASELIKGVEAYLQELELNRSLEQEQDIALLIRNTDLTEYDLVNVRGMEPKELHTALSQMDENDRLSVEAYLESMGAWVTPIEDGEKVYVDYEYNTDSLELIDKTVSAEQQENIEQETKIEPTEENDMSELSVMQQAEKIIAELEAERTVFSHDEKNLIVNYAYKMDDMDKTRELAEHLYYEKAFGNQNVAPIFMNAQEEIDALPDSMIGLSEMREYGYSWKEMLPLTQEKAMEMFEQGLPVYVLRSDGTEGLAEEKVQITEHDGIFGIEKSDWEREKNLLDMREELEDNRGNLKSQLLYGSKDTYGIYQLKHDPELTKFRFEGTESLMRMGILKDNYDEIKPKNYELVYVGELSELQGQTQSQKLGAAFEKFNIDRPQDFTGHSLSVSDIVVLHQDGENSSHFVDSFGFTELPDFTRALEGILEQKNVGANLQDQEQKLESGMESIVEEGDEIIDLGEDKEQVLADMKNSLAAEQETELAFQIADRYISIQETTEGYDYSIMGIDYKEIDGGVYDNPDITIREALSDIVEDLKSQPEHDGAKGSITEKDELIPIDYDGLMEKVEQANQIIPEEKQSSVVADFKEKTKAMFHEISEMNPEEIEETIKCHVQAKIDEYGIDASIVDVAVSGSRCRGLEKESSDIDVVVELSTDEREDDLHNAFNEDGLHIGDVKVDINPITKQRTGTLETYLPTVEEYLDNVRQAREQEPISLFSIKMHDEERFFQNINNLDVEELNRAYVQCSKPFVEMEQFGRTLNAAEYAELEQGNRLAFSMEFNVDKDQINIFDGENIVSKGLKETLFPKKEVEVTLYVAECGEFHTMGEFYENIISVDEAIKRWKEIPPDRMNGIPAIGICVHREGEERYQDDEIDLLSGKRIDLSILEYVPSITNEPKAMEVVAEIVAKMLEIELYGASEEMEAKIWEKRMPELSEIEQLAVMLDRFAYDYDTNLYHDSTRNMTENVSELTESIKNGDTEHLTTWFADVIAESDDSEEIKKATELLEKLSDYKPLAKIEELEEQNYNMIDNVLNNGIEKRATKEKTSLKARLEEKREQVAGSEKVTMKQKDKKEQKEI